MLNVVYARVSTETQEKQQTIESQLAELRRHADAQGLTIAQEFIDDGYSGTMLERPGLDALRDCVSAGVVETVLVLCPDRLSRNYLHLGILMEDFQKRGVRLAFVNQRVDDTPEGKLLLQIQGAVGEYERVKIMDRTRRGKKHKAEQGHIVGGVAAYGYDYIRPNRAAPGRWEINEAEAKVVREVYRLFIEEQLGIRAIIHQLAELGISTRAGNASWTRSHLHKLLTSEVYIGQAYYFKTYPDIPEQYREHKAYRQNPKTTKRRRDRSEWIPVPVPAIIDAETFGRARQRLDANQRFSPRNTTEERYLLRGLLKCKHCGLTFAGTATSQAVHYACRGKRPEDAGRQEKCPSRYLRADRVEPLVWQEITDLLKDPDLLLRQWERRQEAPAPSAQDLSAQREAITKQIAQADREEMTVVRLYREGKIGEALLDAQLAEVRSKRDALRRQIEVLDRDSQAIEDHTCIDDAIRAFCAKVSKGLETATFDDKQKLLREAIDRIEVEPDADSGTLYGVIPLPSDCSALRPRLLHRHDRHAAHLLCALLHRDQDPQGRLLECV